MNQPQGRWQRFVYKRIVAGDIRKLSADSADSDTGGGARDFRFNPADKFWPVFERMFTSVASKKYLDASLIWDGETTKTEVYPPTAARPNETRLTRVNACCPSNQIPDGGEKFIFMLIQGEDGVHASFMTKQRILKERFTQNLEQFLIRAIENSETAKVPTGFVDLETCEQYSSIGDAMSTTKFQPYFEREDILAAIRTKPFILLAGVSGTGKSRMVRELARGTCPRYLPGGQKDHPLYNPQKPGNFESIAVRPSWHDSTELVGFVSRASGQDAYQVTDFVKFLCKAWRYEKEGIPFFICLDEMNLAPVEQYFAEYLSVIESRQKIGGKIVTDPLIRFKNEELLKQVISEVYSSLSQSEQDSYLSHFKNAGGIPIPSNLVVMGTVNMDETTFSFSRKVLDRAMSFELNEVEMDGGLLQNPNIAYGSLPSNVVLQVLVKGYEAYAESPTSKDICDKVVGYLSKVNALLDGTPFKVAYRTRDEAVIYCIERTRSKQITLVKALDEVTSMKILSRIEGDSMCLTCREGFVVPAGYDKPKNLLHQLKIRIQSAIKELDPAANDASYSICTKKLDEMDARLKGGFTGFWQ